MPKKVISLSQLGAITAKEEDRSFPIFLFSITKMDSLIKNSSKSRLNILKFV